MITANRIIKIFAKFLLSLTSLIIIDSNFASDLRFEQLTIKSGLPSLVVNQIMQDSDGYIWFATHKGVVKYNGYYFENFNSQSTPSLLNDTSYKIIEDKDHNYWITSEGGLTKINGDYSSYYFDGYVSNIIATKNNLLVVFKNILYSYNSNADAFEKFEGFPLPKNITSIYSIGDSSIIINKKNESFYYNDDLNEYKKIEGFSNVKVDDYIEFDNYYLIVLRNKGLYKFYKSSKTIEKIENLSLLSTHIVGIKSFPENKDYNLIVIYDNGDSTRLNTNNDYYIHQRNNKNIEVMDFLVDNSGVLWLATKKSGVFKYSFLKDGTLLTKLNEPPTNMFSINKDIYYTDKENIYCLSDGCTDLKYLNLKYVWEVKTIDNENYFISHKGGLSKYNSKTKKLVLLSDNITAYTFSIGSSNEIFYFASSKRGINQFFIKENKVINLLDENSLFGELGTYALRSHYKNGVIYIGTINGLYSYNLVNNSEYLYEETKSLNINDVVASNNGLWISIQSKGLYYLNFSDNQLDFIKVASKDISNISIIDKKLYLSHKDGIIEYDVNTLEQKNYKSLFVDLDFEFLNSNSINDKENIYFATSNGYLTVSKKDIQVNNYKALTRIDKITINDEEKDILSIDDLDYEDNNIRVYFSSSDNSFPENITFKYRLIGFNDSWKITSNNFVDYTNLSSGKYVFEVLASNSDGIFEGEPNFYSFNIKKPWWYFVLFILAGFTFILLCFIAVNRYWQIKQLKLKAITDSTTGIYNRYKFNIEVEKSISKNIPFSLIFLDLDHFKEINDSLGHDAGDDYISHIAKTIRESVGKNGIVARIGGDEFAVLFFKYFKNKNTKKSIIHKILMDVRKEHTLKNKIIKGSASIGVVNFPENGNTTQQLLQHADVAMYASKNNGRNNITFFDDEMIKDFNEKAEIRYQLKNAVIENEFELHYQPKVCKHTQKYIGFESLIRWNSKDRGMVSPAIFIPESENNGTILEIGKWVIFETCRKAAYLDSKGLLKDNISLNMSPKQFMQENIDEILRKAIAMHSVNPKKIEIEITESVFASDTRKILRVMNKIKKLGVSIALDDFGSGYSSLSYLTKFPIDTLKIDRAFVRDIENNKTNIKVLKNIFNLAKDLGMSVVVEGVETKEQLDIISQYDFKSIQGFYYSPPIKCKDVEDSIK